MQWRNTAQKYGIVGQALHWVVVLGIIASYFIAEAAEDEEAGGLMGLHRSVGITILALAALRLLWRLADRTPPWPAGMAAHERVIARVVHALFYALLFALPLTGWMISSAEGDPVRWFGLVELPTLSVGASEDTLEELHEVLFNVLFALAVLHALAALKHHFWDRDPVLRSMLPGRAES
jgi:cytochrome b561